MSAEPPGPRVPATEASENVLRQILQELSTILNILEGRFLHLVKEGGRGAIPPEAVVGELTFLSRDLAACFRRLGEIEERRDLSFKTAMELQEIDHRCVWLFRKIRLQEVFLRKLNLETHLQRIVSSEAFTIYQTLLSLDEEEREIQSSDDPKIRAAIPKEKDPSNTPPQVN